MHRYSMDEEWRVPHFEKMLYDQGLLLSALAQAAPHASSDEVRDEYAHAAAQIESFLRREMAAPGGGFVASLSADTGGVEGATYVWTHAELAAVLDAEQLEVAQRRLGAEPASPTAAFTLIREGGRDAEAEAIDAIMLALRGAREKRPQPDVDGKVLTAWNALAARGLMEAGSAFGLPRMAALGADTALALQASAWRDDGVVREATDPTVCDVRVLEDAAMLTAALISVAEVGGNPAVLERAVALHADTIERFAIEGVLYMTPATSDLPVRPLENGDGATPSGAATVMENALRLGAATGDAEHLAFARAAVETFWGVADYSPERAGRALAVATKLAQMAP